MGSSILSFNLCMLHSRVVATQMMSYLLSTHVFSQKLLQRLEASRPTRSLSRDSLLKDHLKQKQYSKTASRSRPSSAKSTSSSVSHFSRSPSDRVKSDDWRFAECCKFQDIKWLTSICTGEKNFQTCMGIWVVVLQL